MSWLPRYSSIPFERAFLPFIGKADSEGSEEHHHRPESGRPQFAERQRPREKERHFEIDDDDEVSSQIEADVELHAVFVACVDSGFISRDLLRIRLMYRQQER